MSLADDISALLNDTTQTAPVSLLVTLLRVTPGLRQWLHLAMSDPGMRHRLDAYLDGKLLPPLPPAPQTSDRNLLAWVAGIINPLDETDPDHLRATYATAAPTHGGLTRSQVFALIRRHQAGPLALAPFLLVALWRKAAIDHTALPAALLATQKFFAACLVRDNPAPLRQLAHAATFFQGQALGKIGKTHYGHPKWWQLNILAYMLANPRPAYRTRDLSLHLAAQKIQVDPADIRRFCRKHNITRNHHPGRPCLT